MSPEPLLDRLRRGDAIVADGAWGTALMARGLGRGQAPEQMSLERPEVLGEVAAAYLEAGAEIITTNTFGGTPLRLRAHGLDPRTEEVNARAVEAALRAAAGRALVMASVGPTGVLLRPWGEGEPEEVEAAFARQIGALASAGADVLCIETMTDLGEATLAIGAARRVAPHLPVVATMTFDATPRGPITVMGIDVAKAAAGLKEAGAHVVGSNCGQGIEAMVEVARAFATHAAGPLAIQANAGRPVPGARGLSWPETPEDFARHTPALLAAGVRLVGGCCGTTPDHVRALRRAVDAWRGAR